MAITSYLIENVYPLEDYKQTPCMQVVTGTPLSGEDMSKCRSRDVQEYVVAGAGLLECGT
jgi:hypothetical protein